MTNSPPTFQQTYSISSRLLGAVLSFVIPGAGQVFQGVIKADGQRLTKGLFFFVALVGMFVYGMYLGRWKNVYVPHWQEWCLGEENEHAERNFRRRLNRVPELPAPATVRYFGYTFYPLPANLITRLQYVGQFWIGLPAWPALWNYYEPDKPILTEYYPESPGARPAEMTEEEKELPKDRQPTEADLIKRNLDEFEFTTNRTHNDMGKMWDIAWVYTVLAGVLNILVIYDAFAGPFHPRMDPGPDKQSEPLPPGGAA